MEKPKIHEVIVVEGRYDKNTLSQLVDATIIDTAGFGLFKDNDKLNMLRKIAKTRGLIILTDGDGAGFVIRNYLKGALGEGRVLHAYIPDIEGKERRKHKRSAEGKLGVEGMSREVLLDALKKAGATFEDNPPALNTPEDITKADLYTLGLSGHPGSKELREKLVTRLGLPLRISPNALYDYLRVTMMLDELKNLVGELPQ